MDRNKRRKILAHAIASLVLGLFVFFIGLILIWAGLLSSKMEALWIAVGAVGAGLIGELIRKRNNRNDTTSNS
ncbi:hypothetical protein [Porphyromonas gulae]|uniref:hypothetical protein n=1 Tax=Porphyromonas gulae TaxID=111105 RepID=UPI0026EC8BA5|nr:hypothetical protein [Porphyromonas gulae]